MNYPSKIDRLNYFSQRMLAQVHLKDINEKSQIYENIIQKYKNNPKGKILDVPRVNDLNGEDFYRDYFLKGLPVIISGKAKKWDCLKNWSPESLEKRFGDDPVMVTNENVNDIKVEDITLKEVIDAMKKGDTSKYARFNNLLFMHPELVNDLDLGYLNSIAPRAKENLNYQIFMGAKGSKTSLHAAVSHNLFIQVYGSKHWYLVSPRHDLALRPPANRSPYFISNFDPAQPDYQRYPSMEYVDMYEFELHEGDILFNPACFWHQVKNLTPSIGCGCRWFDLRSSANLSMTQLCLLLTASNPSLLFTIKNRRDYSKIFKAIKK